MMPTKEKILESLAVIQEVCIHATSCSACPLRDWGSDCKIQSDSPDAWNIKREEEDWRAFE